MYLDIHRSLVQPHQIYKRQREYKLLTSSLSSGLYTANGLKLDIWPDQECSFLTRAEYMIKLKSIYSKLRIRVGQTGSKRVHAIRKAQELGLL